MLYYTTSLKHCLTRSTTGHILAVAINTKHAFPHQALVSSKWHSGKATCWREFVDSVDDTNSWQQAVQISQSVCHL